MWKLTITYKDLLTNQVVIYNPKAEKIISKCKLREFQANYYDKTGEIEKKIFLDNLIK